jgi:4-amino-4-deoxy-L-arabinose transferase-like glycosyltransferase
VTGIARPDGRRARVLWARAAAITRNELLVLTGAVALIVRLPFLVGPVNGTGAPDSVIYLAIADDLVHGRGFHAATELRTPGYPLLIAPFSWLPGRVDEYAVPIQHLLGVAVILALVLAAWHFFSRGAAMITAAIAAISPTLVNLEGDVLPDFLLAVMAAAGALVLARALEQPVPRLRLVAAAGVIFGVAALVKPAGQAFAAAAIVPLLLDVRHPARGLRAGAVLVGCLVLTISPWLARNAIEYGDVRLSVQDGPALWLREFDWDRRPVPTSTSEGRLAKRLYDETSARTPGAHPTDTYESVLEELEARHGYSEHRATALQRRLAVQAIRDAPKVYALGTWAIARDLYHYTHRLYWGRLGNEQKAERTDPRVPTGLTLAAFAVAERVVWWWWILSLGLFSVLLLPFTGPRRQRVAALTLGVTWVALTVATAATTFPDARYAAEGVPLLWVLGSAGVAFVLGAVVRRARSAERPD